MDFGNKSFENKRKKVDESEIYNDDIDTTPDIDDSDSVELDYAKKKLKKEYSENHEDTI